MKLECANVCGHVFQHILGQREKKNKQSRLQLSRIVAKPSLHLDLPQLCHDLESAYKALNSVYLFIIIAKTKL